MAKFIRLTGENFNNPNLPLLTDLAQMVSTIPTLHSWINAEQNNYYYDVGGDLVLTDLAAEGVEYKKATGRSNGPIVVDSVLNTKSVIRFNGDLGQTGGLERSLADMPIGTNPLSFACVVRVTDGDTSATQHFMSTATVNNYGFNLYSSSLAARAQLNPGSVTLGNLSNWHILIASAVGTTVKALSLVDLETVVTNTATYNNTQASMFLGQHSLTGSKFVGDMAEAMVFDMDIFDVTNAAYLAQVISYFKTKFNL